MKDTHDSLSPERRRRLTDALRRGAVPEIGHSRRGVAGGLGGKVGIAPRLFLKKLVSDVLDRVDQFTDFDPHQHYAPTLNTAELTEVERNAATPGNRADDVPLDL